MWPPLGGLMQFWRRPVIEERPEAEICPITHWPVPRLIHFNLGRIYQSWGQLICLQLSNSCLLYRPKEKLIIFNVWVRTGCIKEKRICCNYKLLSGECGVWVAALWDRISACALLQIRNTHFADNNDGFFWRNDGDGDEDYGDDDDKQNTSTDFTAILALPEAKAKTCLSEGNIREHDLVCVFYVAGRRLDESFMPKIETLKWSVGVWMGCWRHIYGMDKPPNMACLLFACTLSLKSSQVKEKGPLESPSLVFACAATILRGCIVQLIKTTLP